MKQYELDKYFKSILNFDCGGADPSKNGLQIENDGTDITKIAFAVDACVETALRAAELGAGMLFVHHGLFWGTEQTLTGTLYKRVSAFMNRNIALYACHLPLDADKSLGNNSCIADFLGLRNKTPFGQWRGFYIGFKGDFEKPITLDEAAARLFPQSREPLRVLPFGKKTISKAAIVSGGGADELSQAIAEDVDLFITGEIGHEQYHEALENGINVIAAGHYATETLGVQAVARKLTEEKEVETLFIHVPTGL